MGGAESHLSSIRGFQIVRVANNSPAHVAGLVPFFDFVLAVDNLPLDEDNKGFFFDYVKKNKGHRIALKIFNLRIQATRDVSVVPSDTWGGIGLLGCNVNWESAEAAMESTWRIVDVVKNTPAYAADLMPHRDHILGMQLAGDGTQLTLFRDSADFHGRVEDWRAAVGALPVGTARSLLFLIYDSVENSVKEILLDMSQTTSLGIDVANGYLHCIPTLTANDGGTLPHLKRFVVPAPPVAGTPPGVPSHPTWPHPSGEYRPAPIDVSRSGSSGIAPTSPAALSVPPPTPQHAGYSPQREGTSAPPTTPSRHTTVPALPPPPRAGVEAPPTTPSGGVLPDSRAGAMSPTKELPPAVSGGAPMLPQAAVPFPGMLPGQFPAFPGLGAPSPFAAFPPPGSH